MANENMDSNFIFDIIDEDLREDPTIKVHTRFPPEPNGYLHIGSAKAICINTEVARKYGGLFNLRYDDTNPAKEHMEFVRSIREDLDWLGAEPTGGVFYGSDYFGKCYEFAVQLIRQGDAYVCDLSKDDLAEYKGTDRAEASRESPYRNRSVEENLALFERMKNGEFPDGAKTLRAKIDPATPTCATRSSTASGTSATTGRAMHGASTPCMTSRIPFRTRWKASPTRCAPASSRTTARCMSGSWITSALPASPSSASSDA